MHHLTDNLIDQLDRERLHQLYEDDTEMLGLHIRIFLDEVILNFPELEKRIRLQNWKGVTLLTHQLRPWLGMVGLTGLEFALKEIENKAKNNPDPSLVLLLYTNFSIKFEEMKLVLIEELRQIK